MQRHFCDCVKLALVVIMGLAGVCGTSSHAASAEITARLDAARGVMEWEYAGHPLAVYSFGSNQFKPYLKDLHTLRGDSVLRDAPADHLHHHGLMYAIRVNGVNFWEERDQPGRQVPVGTVHHRERAGAGGMPEAVFSHTLHWVAHTNVAIAADPRSAMLIERRTLVLGVDPSKDEVSVRWKGDFEVGPAAGEGARLHGSAYNGLGLRLPAAWDHVARHGNSDSIPYTREQTGDVTAAHWAVVSTREGDHEPAVALFTQPRNRGDTRFFSMLNPFTYLAVTQNLEKQPISLSKGDRFQIDYLISAFDTRPSDRQLEERHQAWLKEAGR
jgi:hypothetical protein